MRPRTLMHWSWLNVLTTKRYDKLIAQYGSLDSALEHVDEEMLRNLGCREDTILKTLVRSEEFDSERYLTELNKRELSLLSIEDDEYPARLRTINDPPVFLYFRGELDILKDPCIAFVGTREMSIYGKRIVQTFIPDIVRANIITVSGLAYGIDAEVAKETLQTGGRTVAVLGHGLGMIYPKAHSALADEIVARGGLILSEFPLDAQPDKFTFPARNRIIAGLSLATVVLEADEESGSLITAELALDYNRDVFAVPGPIFDASYAGCHHLIATGQARITASPQALLADLGIVASERQEQIFLADSPEEQNIFDSLTSMPQSLDELSVKAKLNAAILSATLTMLELKGVARNVGEGKWVKA